MKSDASHLLARAKQKSERSASSLLAHLRRDRGWLDDGWRTAFIEVLDRESTEDDRVRALSQLFDDLWRTHKKELGVSLSMALVPEILKDKDGNYSESNQAFLKYEWELIYKDAYYDVIISSDGLHGAIIIKKFREDYDLVSPENVQNEPAQRRWPELQDLISETDLSEATRLYVKARELGFTVEKAIETLEREAKDAARETTTGRAKAKRRLKWEKDARPGENPAEFAWRAYQAEAKAEALHRGLIGREDKLLRRDLNNWLRTHPMPKGIDIPTYPEWNTRRLAETASPPRAVRVLTEEGRLHEAARYRARKAEFTKT
jgi:hypothetical protein